MFSDYNEKLAKLIVQYAVKIEPEDTVIIKAPTIAEPLVKTVYRETLRAGGHVILVDLSFDGQDELFFKFTSDNQLKYVNPIKLDIVKTLKKYINIYASFNTRDLTSVPPEKKVMVAEAGKEMNKIFLERASTKELRWNISPFPCNAFAQEANMGPLEYLEFAYKALNLHQPDPVKFWQDFEKKQQHIVDILNKGSFLQIIGEDTDLTLGIAQRPWENCSGHENLPDGEVFTAPIEDAVNGTIRFTYPGIFSGQEIEDIRLTFKDGKVVDFDADKGKDLLNKIVTTIPNANILGELAVGTNYGIQRFTKNMLFDEKMGGTVHLALGAGYPETGSKNESSIHWDILKDMKSPESKILLDGEMIYKEGKWLI
ncbi:aminopeptidase [Candidatus Heimdallarchaeota archaeon B3_Heim]|nr:MAG: aminopeptidase [Candidatus Heimdallarchaeota archaeon B3_Heim]